MTPDEIKAFLSLTILMGIVRKYERLLTLVITDVNMRTLLLKNIHVFVDVHLDTVRHVSIMKRERGL